MLVTPFLYYYTPSGATEINSKDIKGLRNMPKPLAHIQNQDKDRAVPHSETYALIYTILATQPLE